MHKTVPMITAALMLASPMALAQDTTQESMMNLTPDWEYVADTVMGGVSTGQIARVTIAGRDATRLTGEVSLDNNGGFVQMAFDLDDGAVMDATGWTGIEITIIGNNEPYDLRLRTTDLQRPWHSYRTEVTATGTWQTLRIPFAAFEPHRTDIPLNITRLRRLGVLAIGRAFQADVAVADVGLYK